MFVPAPGHTLGHYRIVRKLGAGGMGEVYEATDTSLDRRVALKMLSPELANDPGRRERLGREARALAALNHPHIVTVHSVEHADGIDFITMELVSGKTLAELLPSSGFEVPTFFRLAIPLTDALAAAHAQGITHRDLKPANVMVAEDGRVKVLDFGLAHAPASGNVAECPTITATARGLVMGTPLYMSPEQAEGALLDARSDIFALGVVFYEMLTGQRPFAGSSHAAIVSSILRDSPRPITQLNPAIPRDLGRLVHRCLEKNPRDRYQSVLDVRHRLQEIEQDLESDGDAAVVLRSRPTTRRRLAVPLLAGLVLASAGVAWWLVGQRPLSTDAPALQNAVQVTSSLDVESYPTWSPDGGRIAYQASKMGYYYIGDHDIWVSQIGSGEPVNITRHPANDRMPSWSPDGREIAFFSNRDGTWGVFLVSAIGGSPRNVLSLPEIGDLNWSAPQWSKDGSTLFVSVQQRRENVVIILSLASLTSSRVTLPPYNGNVIWDLTVSPDGRRFAYAEGGGGATEVTRLWTIAVDGTDAVPLTEGFTNIWSPKWSNDGRWLYYVSNRGGSMDLWRQEVRSDGTPDGEPVAVTRGLGIRSAALSPDGSRIAYGRGGRVTNIWRVPIRSDQPATWADATAVTSERAYIEFLDVSPDATLLALSSDRRGNPDLWLLPVSGGDMTQLTTDPAPDWNPRWSPNGQELAFYSYRSGNRDIWVMPARGGAARQLSSYPGHDRYPAWSPDGSEIAFQSMSNRFTLVTDSHGKGHRTIEGAAGLNAAAIVEWSPDGQSLVFNRQGLHRVSRGGGDPVPLPAIPHQASGFRFTPDGRSIIYSVIFGPTEHHHLWQLSLDTGSVTQLTRLEGRRGGLNENFTTDGRSIYFTWREDDGDIWVMDTIPPEND
jgi:Tol biopolymer transport system component